MSRSDGVLNVNKPRGITSFAVVSGLRKTLGLKKIGHGGTLDPEASGVLPIYLNKATKIAPFLMDLSKEYLAVMHLGIVTDTQDATGRILEKREPVSLSEEQIMAVLASFTGEIEQVPPMFSALKYRGRRLYEMARQGIEVAREPRRVVIYRLTFQGYDPPYLTFHVSCSRGTYIRTLCADIGDSLGVGGHMVSLHRTRVGELNIEESIPYQEITREKSPEILANRLYSMDRMLHFLPVVQLTDEGERRIRQGISLSPEELAGYPDNFRKGDLFRGHNAKEQLLGVLEALVDSETAHALRAEDIGSWFKARRLLIR
ncbi:MAG: tRNA pseudouridine(55) synthase TruB [bacterium]